MSEQFVKHVGLHAYRLSHPYSDREKAFSEEWRKENTPPSFINGRGTLDHLLYMSEDQRRFTGESTEREETVAATVIQWLGTNCGWCFLENVIKRCGFNISPVRDDFKWRLLPAEQRAFQAGCKLMREAIIAAIQRDQAWVDVSKVKAVPEPNFSSRW